jgi:hypothetical protein
MIEHSHPHERRMAFERAIAEQRDGGLSYYLSLGMPRPLAEKIAEQRARKLAGTVRPAVTPVASTDLNAADLF